MDVDLADSDFLPTANIETINARAALLRRTRAFFDEREFTEVQTPLLSADTVVDRHLDPVPVLLPTDPFDLKSGREMWLQSSPEFAMKRLLAAGMEAIYQITPAFRIGESGTWHNPEFTMLEWYRVGDTYESGMDLLSDVAIELLGAKQTTGISIESAFKEFAGFNPFGLEATELKQLCQKHSISSPTSIESDDWDAWFDLLFTELVQPNLGMDDPVIVFDYPASQAALAKIRADGEVAERFELFWKGVELANGYHELLDAEELLHRNESVNRQRVADGKQELPLDSLLLDAMRSGLPACVGVAMGIDRVLMLLTGVKTIADVIAFPVDRA